MQGNNTTGQNTGQGGSNPPAGGPPGQNQNQNQNQKQSGLSWSQPAAAPSTSPLMPTGQQKSTTPPAPQSKPVSPPAAKPSSPGPDSSKRIRMIAGGVGIAALLIGAWIIWGGGASTPGSVTETSDTGTATTTTTTASGIPSATMSSGALTTLSPQAAGLTVAITSISVAVPTWVVVYESSNGEPGRALGATLFFPENNGKGGTVALLRATQPGQTYLIGENVDGGDRVFSLKGDKPVTGADGQLVWYTFTTR